MKNLQDIQQRRTKVLHNIERLEGFKESQNKFHLTNKLLTTKLINSSFQSDITKGSLFAKYEFVVSKNEINNFFENMLF